MNISIYRAVKIVEERVEFDDFTCFRKIISDDQGNTCVFEYSTYHKDEVTHVVQPRRKAYE